MTQKEVINILKKANKPLTSTEIARILKIGDRSVRRNLNALFKDSSERIKFKKLTPAEKKKKYGKVVKIPIIRVYYLKK